MARPKGSKDLAPRRTAARKQADAAAAEGITPLEVMLRAMREHAGAGRWDEAAEIAKAAAPYMHARLAAIQHSGPDGGPVQVEHAAFVDRPPAETREEWIVRRQRELDGVRAGNDQAGACW